MNTPVETQILDAAGERLATMLETHEYFYTAKKLTRGKLTPWKGAELPAINYWAGSTEFIERGAGFVRQQTEILIEYHKTTRENPFVDIAHKLGADILIAINRKPDAPLVSDTPSIALGGLVESLQQTSLLPIIGEGQSPFCGVLVAFSAVYKTKPHDPFTLIH